MRATVIFFDACPHWELARDRLELAIVYAGVGHVEVDLVSVTAREEALERAMRGSPTILIDGADLFVGPVMRTGLACRTFATEHGTEGSPSVVQLVHALRGAHNGLIGAPEGVENGSFPASDPPEGGGPGL